MGRSQRKKKRTHVIQDAAATGPKTSQVPMTFVMERGTVGSALAQLVLDLRHSMEPCTASRLKVRKRNVLKDFVHVAGPLGVTHFVMVSRTEEFVNLKVSRLPRGPTLTFHVKSFSLAREVLSNQKKPSVNPKQFLTPPLLVMNNFSGEKKQFKLMSTMFQNMFPSVNVQTVKLASIKRCVLFNYNQATSSIEFRHYGIRIVPRGVSRGLKKITRSHVPDLSKYRDISDVVLGGNVSESEGEEMAGEGDVILPQDLPGRGNVRAEQSSVRLSELGPRLTLELVKIESGLCEGEVLFHAFKSKTKRESQELRKRLKESAQLKLKRRKLQEANVKRKKMEREMHKQRSLAGTQTETLGKEASDNDDNDDDDTEWYRQEVGEEPEASGVTLGAESETNKWTMGKKRQGVKRRQRERLPIPQAKRARFGGREGGKSGERTGKGHRPGLKNPLVKFASSQRGRAPKRRQAGRVFRRKAQT